METIQVQDSYGRVYRVAKEDWENEKRGLLPFYTRRGIKWTHTKTGMRKVSKGWPFGILRENIVKVV